MKCIGGFAGIVIILEYVVITVPAMAGRWIL